MSELEKRCEWLKLKLISFLSNKYNLILIGILLLAAVIRLKYLTINSAVWWDEADYLSLAKHYAFGTPEIAAPWRARAMSMFYGIFYFFGANEVVIRLIQQLFSVGAVYLTYLVGKKFYDKKVGLIAAFCFSVFWVHLFWSARISGGVFGLVIWIGAALCFWEGYVKKKSIWYVIASSALIANGIYAYEAVGFIFPFLFVYILITEKWRFFKNKRFWILVLAFLLAAAPLMTYNHNKFGSVYPRLPHMLGPGNLGGIIAGFDKDITEPIQTDWQRPIGQIISDQLIFITNLPSLLKMGFFILFLIGLIRFFDIFLGFDLIWKNKSEKLKKDFFIFWWAISQLLIVGFLVATTGYYFEPRLAFPAMPSVMVMVGIGGVELFKRMKKHSNWKLAIAILLSVLVVGAYSQLSFSSKLINLKKDSFAQEKPAGLWLKEYTNEGDVIFSCSQAVPLLYYSERFVEGFGINHTLNDELLKKYKPKYVVVDGYSPACNFEYAQQRPDLMRPVQAFFLDEEKKQPIIVIYEVNRPSLENF